jgi:hypothetical protein
MTTTFEVWSNLKQQLFQQDAFRISDLFESIYSLHQGSLSISAYFSALQGLWQELDHFHPIPSCTCAIACHCDLIPTVRTYRERKCIIRFLKGLNEQYSTIRSQVMLLDPLPNVQKVYSMLLQQERQSSSSSADIQILQSSSLSK